MLWTCKHEWELLDKTVLPSGMDQLREAGMAQAPIKVSNADSLFCHTAVVIVACKKCGKIRKFVTISTNY